jgi:hypothetical protein
VVLARFIPIVRTFMNPVAGVLGMPAKQFLIWNIVGAVLWVDGILLAGYLLAEQIINAIGGPEQIDKYVVPFVLIIVLISAIPIFIEIVRGAPRTPPLTLTIRAGLAQLSNACRKISCISSGLFTWKAAPPVVLGDAAQLIHADVGPIRAAPRGPAG